MNSDKKPKASTYSSLLSLDQEVSKKKKPPLKKENTSTKMGGKKRSRSRSPKRDKKYKGSSKSDQKNNKDKREPEINYDIPDRSYGDLYCKPCDAHMNSEQMWEAHVQGKRHLKHTKKGETVDLKYDHVDELAKIQADIDKEKSPIVGLHHICEIQRNEQRPAYLCFLCSANVPNYQQLLEHLLGLKHRMAYLKEHDFERYTLIQNSDLKKGHVEPVVEECILKHEHDKGRGVVCVKREKPKSASFKPRRNFRDNYDSSSWPQNNTERFHDDYTGSDWQRLGSPHSERSLDCVTERDVPGSYPNRNSYSERDRKRDQSYLDEDPGPSSYRRPYEDSRSPDVLPGRDYSRMSGRSNVEEPRYGDLREMLEQKKSLETFRTEPISSSNVAASFLGSGGHSNLLGNTGPSNLLGNTDHSNLLVDSVLSSLIAECGLLTPGNIPEFYLKLIDALNPVIFLQLMLFKLDRLSVVEDVAVKLLDKVVNKATSLLVEVKTRMLSPNLQAQFKESMVQNGIGVSAEAAQDLENLMQMVGHAKASSKPSMESSRGNTLPNSGQQFVSTSQSYLSRSIYDNSCHGLDEISGANRRNDPVYSSPVSRSANPQMWDSQNPNTSSLTTFSSTQISIPGLTLTDDNTSQQQSSPFDLLARQAKDILGSIRTKNDAYNDSSYRY